MRFGKALDLLKAVKNSFLLLSRRQKLGYAFLIASRIGLHAIDLAGLAAVGLLGSMLASGLTGETSASFFGVEAIISGPETYVFVTVTIAALFLSKSVLGALLMRLTTIFLARVEAESSRKVASYIFSQGFSYMKGFSRGEIQWSVNTSSQIAFSSVLFSASALVTESALLIVILTGFFIVDPMAFVFIGSYFGVLLVGFQFAINRRLRRLGERMGDNHVLVANSVFDLISAYREISVLERREFFIGLFAKARRQLAFDQTLQRFVMALPRYFIEAALMVGVLGLVAWQFWLGDLEDGLVVVGLLLVGGVRMIAAVLPLQNSVTELKIHGPQAQKAHSLIAEARRVDSGNQLPSRQLSPKSTKSPMAVDITNVSFSYPGQLSAAVADINLEIAGGTRVALVGPSGAGKSTLVDLILGVIEPTKGHISVGGARPGEMRRLHPGRMAYVPQQPGMVSGSIAENVALGCPRSSIDENRVLECLEMVGLGGLVSGRADGIFSSMGKQSDELSGGQLQRLGIARALYTEPALLVLDEATSGLDAETEAMIGNTLQGLSGKVTVLTIAHRLSTVQGADLVCVLEGGKLLAADTFASVRAAVPFVQKYVDLMRIDD